MSEDTRKEVGPDGGPSQAYAVFVAMEELLDKLKLLNYETEFHQEFRLKSLNRHYFAIQTNPGEQFYMFTSLAAWLIRKSGKAFDSPQEYDDPNSTITNILDALRQMGVTVDFPPNKLKQGYGEQAVFVLNSFADNALKTTHFSWKRTAYPEDDVEEDGIMDDTAEVTLEKVEEEMLADDDDDETILDLNTLGSLSSSRPQVGASESSRPEDILLSTTDSSEWKLEVERVLPQLKISVRSDTKDWRSHLDQMHFHRKEIDESLSVTKTQLNKLYTEITRTLEKIGSREKYINNQLEHLLMEYRTAQDRLAQAKEQYRSVSGGVTERSRLLAQISEELDQVKQEMEERGSSMTDGTPLVNVRKALARLKAELVQIDVRTGVATHTLLQAKVKEKGNFLKAINSAPVVMGIDAVI